MNWSPMRSACHPVGKNGNFPSYGSILCTIKHPSAETVAAFGDAAFSSVIVPTGSQFSNMVSNSFTADRSCATGQSLDEEILICQYWVRPRGR